MNYGINNLYSKPAILPAGGFVPGQRLTVSTASVQITTPPDVTTSLVDLDIQTDDVWVTFDGTTPSSSNGHRLYKGQSFTWSRARAVTAKFIRVTTDAVIQFSESQV